jgi:hypothetical protein
MRQVWPLLKRYGWPKRGSLTAVARDLGISVATVHRDAKWLTQKFAEENDRQAERQRELGIDLENSLAGGDMAMSEVLVGFACPADRADDLRLGENLGGSGCFRAARGRHAARHRAAASTGRVSIPMIRSGTGVS